MNRMSPLVKEGIITERERTSFWLFASQQAHVLSNAMPSKGDAFESRQMAGTGQPFNLSIMPILPIGMRLVGKKLKNDERGRGEEILYMGISGVCDGGIKGFSLRTRSMSTKYAFIACDHLPTLTDADMLGSQRALYGDLLKVVEDVPNNLSGNSYRDSTGDSTGRGDYVVAKGRGDYDVAAVPREGTDDAVGVEKATGAAAVATVTEAVGAANVGGRERADGVVPVQSSVQAADEAAVSGERMLATRPKREFRIRQQLEDEYAKVYKARERKAGVQAIEVCAVDTRPQKPVKPTRQQARREPAWSEAYVREYQKFLDEQCSAI